MIELENSFDSVARGELLLFRTIWNNSTDNMFIVRQDQNGDFISESCNHAQEKTFGLTPHQVDGMKLKDIMDQQIYEQVAQKYNRCISLNKPLTYEERVVLDDTGERCFNTTILPIIDEECVRIFGISREITELLKKEQEKLLLEQTKNTQMAELIENIAHQWRQPLSVISTAASGIKLQKELGIIKEQQELTMLDAIMENTQYLSNTIDSFRNYVQEKKEYKEVILQERLQTAIDLVKASLTNNHILLIQNIQNDEPIKIQMVIGELSEVIINIINNAKDALIKNKSPNPFIKINLERKKEKAIISFEDNGGGIDQTILPKIFDLYFTTKHKSQGTGLGLYMCKNVIEQHLNGRLFVKNSDIGAIFTIELPL